MKREEQYAKQMQQLKQAAEIFLKPMEKLPFPVVVEAMTQCQVIPYIEEDDGNLIYALAGAAQQTIVNSLQDPIAANRPNDVSTQVEKILQENLTQMGLAAETPTRKSGKSGGAQGYPDLLLWDKKRPTYLEVKVSRQENIAKGSARNFFYQPTQNSKITHSARHLLCGFAIAERGEKQWVLVEWKIVDLFHLRVKLKPEYNADNLEIYRPEAIICTSNDTRGSGLS